MDKRLDRWVEAARLRPASATADSDSTGGLEATLWRGVAVFRFLALAVAVPTALADMSDSVSRPLVVLILIAMAAWTVVTTVGYARRVSRAMLFADLGVALACLLASIPAEGLERMQHGEVTVPGIWVAATVLAWALAWGVAGGLVAAGALAVGNVVVRGDLAASFFSGRTFDSIMLLLLAGALVGYVAALARRAERVLADGVRMPAATAERERLARQIHDGVLQVLALVQRRGGELGGDAAELGRLAGEQETSLRRLVTSRASAVSDGLVDVRDLLSAEVSRANRADGAAPSASLRVHLSAPAEPVLLPDGTARELVAAAVAALSNVSAHVGADAEAWVLVEDEIGGTDGGTDGGAVLVTVRDDGPGIADGRLAEAAGQGRLGVAQSIVGRLGDLGGHATITSAPGEGTEVELRVPR